MIKDSGNRRKFETGAVRDIQEGKGRCDLLPLDVLCELYRDDILSLIHAYKEIEDLSFICDATRLFIKRFFCDNVECSWANAALELSVHFEEGAKKYGENNWQKGLPENCYLDSGIRHYLKFLRGDTDERHDRAFLWNMVCLIWTVKHKGENNGRENE